MASAPVAGPALLERSFYFDAVRGVSAQLVLVGHALNLCFPATFMSMGTGGLLEARPALLYVQNLGVLVFFCISGFLVTASVLRRAAASTDYGLPHYLLDRFARIFTPLVPLLLLLWFVEGVAAGDGTRLPWMEINSAVSDLALNLTMLFDHPVMNVMARALDAPWLSAGAFGSAEQLWTVVIEWWIYVTFGVVAFAMVRGQRFGLVRLGLLAAAAVVPAYALVRGNGLVVAWVVGMLFCVAATRIAALPRRTLVLLASGAAVLGAARLYLDSWNFYGGIAASLFSAALCAGAFSFGGRRPSPDGMIARLATGLSEISYSVYLVHLSVLVWLFALAPSLVGRGLGFACAFALANAVAVAFWWAFERHYPAVRRTLGRTLLRGAR